MSQTDSPNTPTEDPRKAELEALFSDWDAQTGDAHEPGARDARVRILNFGIRLRLFFSLVLIAVTAFMLTKSWSRMSYWLTSSDPIELGDLREAWIDGQSMPFESNTYVSVKGLVVSRGQVVTFPEDADRVERWFYCPLYQLVVSTERELPAPGRIGWTDIDERLGQLVKDKVVFAEDLDRSMNIQGRLVRGDDVPVEPRPMVERYAWKLKREPTETWVIIDGDKPGDHSLVALLWLLAILVPLVSLYFLWRAIRYKKRVLSDLDRQLQGSPG
ncbi:MAG: hypothetical protein ACI9MR_002735 [Myxococcota bacterium]|jgi:hypothetical protein